MTALQKTFAALAALAVAAVTAPVAGAQNLSSVPNSSVPGSSVPQLPLSSISSPWTHQGPRSYLLALPDNYDPTRAYPVILGFDGWGNSPETMSVYSRLKDAAGGDAIVVYARGVDNAWEGAAYASTDRGQDVAYVRDVVNEIGATLAIDRDRVYAVGMSNGGGMAAALACQAPDLVDGVVSVAGAHYHPTLADCAPGAVPAMIVHGTNDEVIGYEGGQRHGAPYYSARETFDRFRERNGCAGTPVTEQGDAIEAATLFSGTDCAAPTRLVRVDGAGHIWFTSPDATQLTVDFFRSL